LEKSIEIGYEGTFQAPMATSLREIKIKISLLEKLCFLEEIEMSTQ
jgi:hypothetical protein